MAMRRSYRARCDRVDPFSNARDLVCRKWLANWHWGGRARLRSGGDDLEQRAVGWVGAVDELHGRAVTLGWHVFHCGSQVGRCDEVRISRCWHPRFAMAGGASATGLEDAGLNICTLRRKTSGWGRRRHGGWCHRCRRRGWGHRRRPGTEWPAYAFGAEACGDLGFEVVLALELP